MTDPFSEFMTVVGASVGVLIAIGMVVGLMLGLRNRRRIDHYITIWGAYGAVVGLFLGVADFVYQVELLRQPSNGRQK